MNEKESGREHTGIAAEMKVLLREPPLLIGILAVFLLFAVFIIYPFVKILLVPTSADWIAPSRIRNSSRYSATRSSRPLLLRRRLSFSDSFSLTA